MSNPPDPATHAYRQDLADTALAGRVIASHYAQPLLRRLTKAADLVAAADSAADVITSLAAGATLRILDNSLGWAWGYAPDGRVGYVPSSALSA
ncbi:MAG: SH3 domain-containing protein [Sphingomicrobium sp.]